MRKRAYNPRQILYSQGTAARTQGKLFQGCLLRDVGPLQSILPVFQVSCPS
jgi:hypothetical protein